MSAAPSRGPGLVDRFEAARGVRADGDWACLAIARFVADDVRDDVIAASLREALEVVVSSGEGPEELFGPAEPWARGRQAEAAAAGERLADTDDAPGWADLPGLTPIVAAALSVPVAIVELMRNGLRSEYSAGVVALPLMLGALLAVLVVLWHSQIARHALPRTLAVVLPVGLLLVVAAGAALSALARVHLFTGATAWWLVIVVGHLALGGLGFLLLVRGGARRARRPPPAEDLPDDDAWVRELTGVLRSRLSYSDARAQGVAQEARAHAAAVGRPLAVEFGAPRDHASRFRPDRRRRLRWEAIVSTVVAVGWVGRLVADLVSGADLHWATAAGAVLFPLLAARLWRRHAMDGGSAQSTA